MKVIFLDVELIMKRSELLQPLSREHHTALVYAKRLLDSQDDEARLQYWCQIKGDLTTELEQHFAIEERCVESLKGPLPERLLDEHQQLRRLLQAETGTELSEFAVLLKNHVRFEERELFPWLETAHYDILKRMLEQ